MKYFLVIALLAFIGFLLYRKLRPYLRSLRQIIDTIRQFQSAVVNQRSPDGKSEKLVRCETCGTWIPAGRTLPGSGDRVFCSVECRKAEGSRQKAVGRRQKAVGSRQKAEGRRQKAEGVRKTARLCFVRVPP